MATDLHHRPLPFLCAPIKPTSGLESAPLHHISSPRPPFRTAVPPRKLCQTPLAAVDLLGQIASGSVWPFVGCARAWRSSLAAFFQESAAILGLPELAGAPYRRRRPLLFSLRLRSELIALKPLFEFTVSSSSVCAGSLRPSCSLARGRTLGGEPPPSLPWRRHIALVVGDHKPVVLPGPSIPSYPFAVVPVRGGP